MLTGRASNGGRDFPSLARAANVHSPFTSEEIIMPSRRFVLAILAGSLFANMLHAQSVNLTEAPLESRCVRNELTMQLAGKITFKQDGKDLTFPHKAEAKHIFLERFL